MAARRLLAAAGALQHSGEEAAKGSGELLVYVKTNSETVPVTVDAGGTVGCLTDAVAAALSLDSGRAVLLLKGQRLDSGGRDVPLADCGVSQEECLTLCPTAFSCIAHREAALSVEEGTDGSILVTRLGSVEDSNALAYFDPLLNTDCSAEWSIEAREVDGQGCCLVGLTSLDPAEHGDVMLGKGETDSYYWMAGHSQVWAYEDDENVHCGGSIVGRSPSFQGPASIALKMHGRSLTIRVEDESEEQSVGEMELPPGVPVRFFACLYNGGAALRVKCSS
eukprot:TRINITY_DN615_c0_g1_i13.p1 TRINITY_DN615_c0_g1~~TRINITY_DN615_c0_g1_i13.p1  ORF type:complete len:279 (+),score=70.60 TRINITY_DN615_c0_g1_i13:59-895(+)